MSKSENNIYLPKRLKIFFNYFLAPILLVWLGINLYQQVIQQKNNAESWALVGAAFTGKQVWKIILACLLVALNWSIEAKKWQLLMRPLQSISFFTAIKATLAGTSFAANTPNRVGEYFGRMIYLEEGKRLQSIPLTMVGSFSQLIVTLIFGAAGCFVYRYYLPTSNVNISALWINIIFIGTLSVASICLLLFFKMNWFVASINRLPFMHRFEFFIKKVTELDAKILLRTFLLSMLRYIVFLLQYILVLEAFGVVCNTAVILSSIMVMFLVMAAIPSFVILEAGIRGTVSVQVFVLCTANVVGIMASGYFIWLINLMAPALVGVILILGKRVFKK